MTITLPRCLKVSHVPTVTVPVRCRRAPRLRHAARTHHATSARIVFTTIARALGSKLLTSSPLHLDASRV